MAPALVIAGKDIRQRLRDRSALLVAIVVPLVLASIFGLIFKDVTEGSACSCDFAVVDRDGGHAARAFTGPALTPLVRQKLITVRRERSVAAARDAVDDGTVAAAFVLPAGLTAAVDAGRAAHVDVIGGVDTPIATQVAQAIAVFFLFFTVQFGISSIVDERQEGTLARILVAPVPRWAVLVGKLLTSLVLGAVSMTVLALATHFLLDAHWGNALGVLALIVAGVLAATAVMALVATIARTPDQAQAWQSMVALVLGMLGGTFFPVAQAGGVLAGLSLLTPQAWFLRGIEDLSGGDGPGAVAGPVAAILAFALVAGALALARAKRLTAR